ncbi:hypothetical protein ACLOJK_008845 [Asimina triloba]
MGSFPENFGIVCGSDVARFTRGCWKNSGCRSAGRNSVSPLSSSLILDSEKGELVKAPARSVQKGVAEGKAKAALKSHSDAERRRRGRINSHLATLRSLVPSTEKVRVLAVLCSFEQLNSQPISSDDVSAACIGIMENKTERLTACVVDDVMDKASLLAEVISHMKELKQHAREISNGCIIPTDFDEVRVESDVDAINKGSFAIKASLCCEDRPEILSDLKHTLQAFRLKIVRAEISTLGGRMKNVFLMKCEGDATDIEGRIFAGSVRQALKNVLDRVASQEFSLGTDSSNKRRRMSLFESSSSSS